HHVLRAAQGGPGPRRGRQRAGDHPDSLRSPVPVAASGLGRQRRTIGPHLDRLPHAWLGAAVPIVLSHGRVNRNHVWAGIQDAHTVPPNPAIGMLAIPRIPAAAAMSFSSGGVSVRPVTAEAGRWYWYEPSISERKPSGFRIFRSATFRTTVRTTAGAVSGSGHGKPQARTTAEASART